MSVLLIVGTDKGGFLLRSKDRRAWSVEGPFFKGWKVTTSARTPTGRFLAATASDVYGPAIHASDDLVAWRQIERGPAWAEGSARKLKQVWRITAAPEHLYAGVDDAGLFASADDGESWRPVEALNEHSARAAWHPGAGGLCVHAILVDPRNSKRLWVGISAVGVFRSDDGGATWTARNDGVPTVIEDRIHKEIGRCNHGLAADPDDGDVIYRREHVGMFRTRDAGVSWVRVEKGLGSWFGFPIAMNRTTKSLFTVPLESDEYRLPPGGRLVVARSRDRGDSWQALTNGLPQEHAWGAGVLRGALDVDHLDPGGVYLGTTAGTVHVSADDGDSWRQLPVTLPRILTVAAYANA